MAPDNESPFSKLIKGNIAAGTVHSIFFVDLPESKLLEKFCFQKAVQSGQCSCDSRCDEQLHADLIEEEEQEDDKYVKEKCLKLYLYNVI